MRKMEQHKHLEPNFSSSFQDLTEILVANYKESSSGSFLGT